MGITKKILVADDDFSMQEFLSAALQSWGYEALLAKDGMECYRLATEHYPDLIILDAYMPYCNGIKAMRLLREDERTKDIPIIGMSGRDQEGERVVEDALISGGVKNYWQKNATLGKPFLPRQLKMLIEKLLGPAPGQDSQSKEPGMRPATAMSEVAIFDGEIVPESGTIIAGTFSLDLGARVLLIGGQKRIDLSRKPKLFQILLVLMRHKGQKIAWNALLRLTSKKSRNTNDPKVLQQDARNLIELLGPYGRKSIIILPKEGIKFIAPQNPL